MHSNLQTTTAKLSNQLALASERHRTGTIRERKSQDIFIAALSLLDDGVGSVCAFICIHSPVMGLFPVCRSFSLIPGTASSPQPFRPDGVTALSSYLSLGDSVAHH